MRTLADFLEQHGVDAAEVVALNHFPPATYKAELFVDAMNAETKFSAFQNLQGNPDVIDAIRSSRYIASFVTNPTRSEVVFAGLWARSDGEQVAKKGTFDGYVTLSKDGVRFNTEAVGLLDPYRGRLCVKWSGSWFQKASEAHVAIERVRTRQPQYRYDDATTSVWMDLPPGPATSRDSSDDLLALLAFLERNDGASLVELNAWFRADAETQLRWWSERCSYGFAMDHRARIRAVATKDQRPEVVVRVGAEGGDLVLYRMRSRTASWEFFTVSDSSASLDGELTSLHRESARSTSFAKGLALLDSNGSWARLHPIAIHPRHRQDVLTAVEFRLAGNADDLPRAMTIWRHAPDWIDEA